MNLRLILALIMCSFAPLLLYTMEATQDSCVSGFEECGTYWCQNTSIKIGKGLIQKQQFASGMSAIVCFTDSYLKKIPATMSYDIYGAAGTSVLDELQSLDEKYCPILKQDVRCPIGEAVCTSAGDLQHVTNIIHTVVPNCVSPKQNRRRKELLQNAYINCLEAAKEKNILQVAFPPIGDIYKKTVQPTKIFPKEEAATVAVKTIAQFVQDNPRLFQEIRLVFPAISDDYAAHLQVLDQISEKQMHKATSEATINPGKLEALDASLLTLVKRYWLKYKNEIILGSCGVATALCAGWILWHRE